MSAAVTFGQAFLPVVKVGISLLQVLADVLLGIAGIFKDYPAL